MESVFNEIQAAEVDEREYSAFSAFFQCRQICGKTEAAFAVVMLLALTLGVAATTAARGRLKSRQLLRNSRRFSRR